jgi:hypothetical protein
MLCIWTTYVDKENKAAALRSVKKYTFCENAYDIGIWLRIPSNRLIAGSRASNSSQGRRPQPQDMAGETSNAQLG